MAERTLAILLLALGLVCSTAFAHPYHVSVAEVTRDAETNRLEIAMRVWPEDLELALSRSSGDEIDLDTTEDIDAVITSYLNKTVFLAPPGDMPPPREYRPAPILGEPDELGERAEIPRLIWVGKEVGVREAWLYFELRLPEGVESAEGLWISSRVLFGVVEHQENVMQVRDGELRVTVRTDERTPWVRIEAEDAPEDKTPSP